MNQENPGNFIGKIILVAATVIITLIIREIYGYFKNKYFGKRPLIIISYKHQKHIEIKRNNNDSTYSLTYIINIDIKNISSSTVHNIDIIFPRKQQPFKIWSKTGNVNVLEPSRTVYLTSMNDITISQNKFDQNKDNLQNINPFKNVEFGLKYLDEYNKTFYTILKKGKYQFKRLKPLKY